MLVCSSVYTCNIVAAECPVTSVIKLCDKENQKARIKDVLYSKFFFFTDLFQSSWEVPE